MTSPFGTISESGLVIEVDSDGVPPMRWIAENGDGGDSAEIAGQSSLEERIAVRIGTYRRIEVLVVVGKHRRRPLAAIHQQAFVGHLVFRETFHGCHPRQQ